MDGVEHEVTNVQSGTFCFLGQRLQFFRPLWSSSNENKERSAILLSFVLTCYVSRSILSFVQSIKHSEKHNLRVTRFYLNLNYNICLFLKCFLNGRHYTVQDDFAIRYSNFASKIFLSQLFN